MTYQQLLTKKTGYANYVLSVTDSKGALGTFRQWLLMQPDVVCANKISTESLSAQVQVTKIPRGTAKGTKTSKIPKKTATPDNDKQSVSGM